MNSMYFIEIKVVMREHHLKYGCKNVVNIDFEIVLDYPNFIFNYSICLHVAFYEYGENW